MNYIEELGQKAQNAKKSLATASTGQKNEILRCIADRLLQKQEQILAENEKDIANADLLRSGSGELRMHVSSLSIWRIRWDRLLRVLPVRTV